MIYIFSPKRIFNNYVAFVTMNINFLVTIISVTITIRKYQVYLLVYFFFKNVTSLF